MPEGLHRLYVRARDNNNVWGIAQSKPVLVQGTGPNDPLPNLVDIEYFFDSDSGFGNATSFEFTHDDTVTIETNLSLTALDLGEHRVYVRAQDETGLWGIAQYHAFTMAEIPVISMNANSFSDSLLAGQSSSQMLIIENIGSEDLIFNLSFQETVILRGDDSDDTKKQMFRKGDKTKVFKNNRNVDSETHSNNEIMASQPTINGSQHSINTTNPGNREIWFTFSPELDTLGPLEISEIELVFNSTNLELGNYSGNLTITSNDPNNPEMIAPISLTVYEDIDILGCTDETGCNYNSEANIDDGTCEYPDCSGECYGFAYEDDCGTCDNNPSNDCFDYELDLHAGANLKSFYALPDDVSLANMMSSLGDNATGVISEGTAATQIASGTWVGSLTHITASKGYWIILDSDATLSMYNAVETDLRVYYLHSGANLISFPSIGTVNVSSALPDILEDFFTSVITEGAATTQISPGVWVGSLISFEGSKGYWVTTDDDIAFSFDLSTLGRSNISYKAEKLNGYQYTQSSKQAFYFIDSVEDIEVGDWILAYNGDKLIGSRQWQGSIIDVPAMGSDGNDYSTSYMKVGSAPSFKLLSAGKLTNLEGDIPAWSDNGLFMIPSLSQVIVPETYSLNQAYPNPFNPTTTLSFAIPVDSEVLLKVYNLQGREVSTLISGYMDAGYHSIIWDANSYASGVYFVKMQAGDFFKTQKLMLIK